MDAYIEFHEESERLELVRKTRAAQLRESLKGWRVWPGA